MSVLTDSMFKFEAVNLMTRFEKYPTEAPNGTFIQLVIKFVWIVDLKTLVYMTVRR